jgi:hypothetical protein
MPKCHCELAPGEDIEYSRGCYTKNSYYRNLPIKEKKSKALFKESVRKYLDCTTVMNFNRTRGKNNSNMNAAS